MRIKKSVDHGPENLSSFFRFFLCSYTTSVRMLYFSVKLAEKKAVVDKRKKNKNLQGFGEYGYSRFQ